MTEDLLPPNATQQEKHWVLSQARLAQLPVNIDRLWDASRCPESLLPWLAWALSVDSWDSAWPCEIKRQVILASVHVHRQKGTIGALKQALQAFGIGIEVCEWFETGALAHTFSLETTLTPSSISTPHRQLDPTNYAHIQNAVERVKPVRSHYQLAAKASFASTVAVGGSLHAVMVVAARMDLVMPQNYEEVVLV